MYINLPGLDKVQFVTSTDGSQTLASRFLLENPPRAIEAEGRNALFLHTVDLAMDIKQLTDEMDLFVRSKGWYEEKSKRPQTPRNLAISLTLEAAEILEHFQFREEPKDIKELADELADVALYLLQLASVTRIDLEKAILDKLEVNKTRKWDEDES